MEDSTREELLKTLDLVLQQLDSGSKRVDIAKPGYEIKAYWMGISMRIDIKQPV